MIDFVWKWMINDVERNLKLYNILKPYIENRITLEMNCGYSPISSHLINGKIIGFDRYLPAIDTLKSTKPNHEWICESSKEFCLKRRDINIDVFALLGICEGQETIDENNTVEDIWEAQSANTLIAMYEPDIIILEKANYKNPINLHRIQKWIDSFYTLKESCEYTVANQDRIRERTVLIYKKTL